MEKKCWYCDESINKTSWSVSKEYTAQSVLIDIYTQFFFVVFSSFVLPSGTFASRSSAIKGLPHPSRCSGYDSLIKITKRKHWHVIHGCAHWILTPRFRFTWPFVFLFFFSNMAAFRSLKSSDASTSASLVLKCWNQSQRPQSGEFSAAVPETLSTSGTPGARR